jgi:hypothetical protein
MDDTAYDFTLRRIQDLQRASDELKQDLLKFDVTRDYQGCFYCPKPKKLTDSALATALSNIGFNVKRNYNQCETNVCFEQPGISVNIYNKVIQRFEADTLYDRIGNGI